MVAFEALIDDKTSDESARETGVTASAVRQHRMSMIQKLKASLEKHAVLGTASAEEVTAFLTRLSRLAD